MGSSDVDGFLPLTSVTFHVLVTLKTEVSHGYAIKRSVEERTNGVVRLGAGTLYHAIRSLARRGLIEECEAPSPEAAGTSRWRFYEITELGERVLRAELCRLEADVAFARETIRPVEGTAR